MPSLIGMSRVHLQGSNNNNKNVGSEIVREEMSVELH